MIACSRMAKTVAIVFCGVGLVDLADADTTYVAEVFRRDSLVENLVIAAIVSLFFVVPKFLRAVGGLSGAFQK